MKANVYVAQLALSRPVFRELVRSALTLLPPTPASPRERVICFDSMAALGKRLGIGRSTVRSDLERLLNYRWLTVEDDGHLLGHRDAGTIYLLADLSAEAATQEKLVVSRIVLSDVLPRVEAPVEPVPAPSARGASRQWRPDAQGS